VHGLGEMGEAGLGGKGGWKECNQSGEKKFSELEGWIPAPGPWREEEER